MHARTLLTAAAAALGAVVAACGQVTSSFSEKPYVVCGVDSHNLHNEGATKFDTRHLEIGDYVTIQGATTTPSVQLGKGNLTMSLLNSGTLLTGKIKIDHQRAGAAAGDPMTPLEHTVRIVPSNEEVAGCGHGTHQIKIQYCYQDVRGTQKILKCGRTEPGQPMHFGDIHAEN